MKKHLLVIPATFALTLSSLPLVPQNAVQTVEAATDPNLIGTPVVTPKITNDGFVLTVSDDKKNLKYVQTEIWDATGTTNLGKAKQYQVTATDKAGKVTVTENYYANSIFTSKGVVTKYKVKVIVFRNDGTRGYKFIDISVNPSYLSPITFKQSINSNTGATFEIGSKLGNLKDVTLEIYNADNTKKLGNGSVYKTTAAKGTDTLTIAEDFTKNVVYNVAGDYTARFVITTTVGGKYTKTVKFSVYQKAINTRDSANNVAGQPIIVPTISNDGFELKVTDDKKNLKYVQTEIWDATGTTNLGKATQYQVTATDKAGSVTVSQKYYANSIFTSKGVDTKYKLKVIAYRNDGTRSYKYIDITVKAAYLSPITFSQSINPDTGGIFKVSSTLGNLSNVTLEIYDADNKKKLGNGLVYKTYTSKGTDTLTLTEDFTKNSIYTAVGSYTARFTISTSNGGKYIKTVKYNVSKAAINKRNNVNKISGKPVIKTAITNDAFVVTVSDDKKNLSHVYLEVWDVNGTKNLGNAVSYKTNATSKAGSVKITEPFYGKNNVFINQAKDTNYKMKVITVRKDGSKAFEFVDFTVKKASTDPIKFSYTVNQDAQFLYYVSSKTGGLKMAKTEIYDSTGKKKLANGTNYTTNAKTGKETLGVAENFIKNKVYANAGTYQARITITLNDGRSYVKWFSYKVSQKPINTRIANEKATVAKAAAEKAAAEKAAAAAKAKAAADAKAKADAKAAADAKAKANSAVKSNSVVKSNAVTPAPKPVNENATSAAAAKAKAAAAEKAKKADRALAEKYAKYLGYKTGTAKNGRLNFTAVSSVPTSVTKNYSNPVIYYIIYNDKNKQIFTSAPVSFKGSQASLTKQLSTKDYPRGKVFTVKAFIKYSNDFIIAKSFNFKHSY